MLDTDFFLIYIFTVMCYIFILFGYLHHSNKKYLLDNILGFSILFIIFFHYSILMILMYNGAFWERFFLPSLFFTPLPIILSVVIVFSIIIKIYYILKKKPRRNIKKENVIRKKRRKLNIKEWKPVNRDIIRKLPHIIVFISFFIIWSIGCSVVYSHTGNLYGMFPMESDLLFLFSSMYSDVSNIHFYLYTLGWFYFFLIMVLYCFAIITLFMEFTRKSKNFSFPLNFISLRLLKKEEKESYGTFLYFFIGHLFAATFLPPLPFFAIISMSSIGDLVASQVGMRTKHYPIKWNKNKCWEGTISSTIVSFFLSYFFLGFIWAFLFAILFLIIDIVIKKPLNASDNLLIPICSTLLFLFLRFSGLIYYQFLY